MAASVLLARCDIRESCVMPDNTDDTCGSPCPVATSEARRPASRIRQRPLVRRSKDVFRLSTDDVVTTGLDGGEEHADADSRVLDAVRAERGLRRYVCCVAEGLGAGLEGVWSELADEAAAYVALDERLPSRPGRDVALVWDDRRGWAVAVETGSGEDLLMVAWYGPELLPAPKDVVRFTRGVLSGRIGESAPQPAVRAAVRQRARIRLAGWPDAGRAG
jgi:Family of unknown function (DUF6292)